MIIGFTGTRKGMTSDQWAMVAGHVVLRLRNENLINSPGRSSPTRIKAVHGDCLGGDEDFDGIVSQFGIAREIYPCTFDNMRAHCERRGAVCDREPKPPMQRNRDIIADADYLIACPPNKERIKSGSGTWATIKFGQRKGMDGIVIYPDGTTDNLREAP